MKRIKTNVLNSVTFSNLMGQYKIIKCNCKSGKKKFWFEKELNINLYNLLKQLHDLSYKISKYNIFLIHENKYRVIMAEEIDDKLVSHFLCNYCLKPALEKKMILQNVATRENLGSKAAYDFFDKFLRSIGYDKNIYVLKIDISKYFYSVSHEILKEKLKKDINDPYALNLLFNIIDKTDAPYVNEKIDKLIISEKEKIRKKKLSNCEKENLYKELDKIPRYEKGKGLSIGCVVNQILSVYYLTNVDRFIKESLGCKYVIRYMDDLCVLSTDKNFLKKIFPLITKEIEDLDLKVNPKSGIFSVNNGFTFLGRSYKICDNKLIVKTRNTTFFKARRRLKSLRKKDFSKYYLSKVSYRGIVNEKYLESIESEYEFLFKKFNCFILMEINGEYVFDKGNDYYLKYSKYVKESKKSNLKFYTYLKRFNYKFIYLSKNVVRFYKV